MANSERTTRGHGAERETATRQDGAPGRQSSHQRLQKAGARGRQNTHAANSWTESAGRTGAGYLGPTPSVITPPIWRRRLYIDRPADLRTLAADLTQARIVAVDAEFSQVRGRQPDEPSHRLALLQLATDNDYRASYVVDALRLADLSPLAAMMASGDVLKLFHGIGADARVLATRGLVARNTLDLEAVSRSIFGQRESGLQAMLQRACGIRLDKSLQRADWSRRPLTPAMVAYAARDAEMTLVLYGWLAANYLWAVELHATAADEPAAPVAAWILPYLEGARPRPVALALAEAGIVHDVARQQADLRHALAGVHHPSQLARVIRLITDLELASLARDLRPYLTAPASEVRAGAARALGRLRDREVAALIRPLLEDPVQDVRQAAQVALDNLTRSPAQRPSHPPRPSAPIRWSSGDDGADDDLAQDGWRAALRASFDASATTPGPPGPTRSGDPASERATDLADDPSNAE